MGKNASLVLKANGFYKEQLELVNDNFGGMYRISVVITKCSNPKPFKTLRIYFYDNMTVTLEEIPSFRCVIHFRSNSLIRIRAIKGSFILA